MERKFSVQHLMVMTKGFLSARIYKLLNIVNKPELWTQVSGAYKQKQKKRKSNELGFSKKRKSLHIN